MNANIGEAPRRWDREADVVVIGAGATGMPAAIVASGRTGRSSAISRRNSRTSRASTSVVSVNANCAPTQARGPAPNGVAPFITNAGKASIDGAELEAVWAPGDKWNIDASYGTLDATIDRLDSIPFAVLPPELRAGNKLPFAPDSQAHVGIAYVANPGTWTVTPRVDVSYTGKQFFDAANTPEIAQLDSVTAVNATVVLGPSAGKWRVTAGVNNATDELYRIAGNSSLTTGSGYAEVAYARPREYFATLTYDF